MLFSEFIEVYKLFLRVLLSEYFKNSSYILSQAFRHASSTSQLFLCMFGFVVSLTQHSECLRNPFGGF